MPAAQKLIDAAAKARENFDAAMDDDFNSAGAIGHIFDLVRAYNTAVDENGDQIIQSRDALEAVRGAIESFDEILGLFHDGFPETAEDVPAEILAMVDARQEARKSKDFAKADEMRDAVLAAGYVIEDTPQGVRVKRA
jgi:cysteinyl-tRNA synthetase